MFCLYKGQIQVLVWVLHKLTYAFLAQSKPRTGVRLFFFSLFSDCTFENVSESNFVFCCFLLREACCNVFVVETVSADCFSWSRGQCNVELLILSVPGRVMSIKFYFMPLPMYSMFRRTVYECFICCIFYTDLNAGREFVGLMLPEKSRVRIRISGQCYVWGCKLLTVIGFLLALSLRCWMQTFFCRSILISFCRRQ